MVLPIPILALILLLRTGRWHCGAHTRTNPGLPVLGAVPKRLLISEHGFLPLIHAMGVNVYGEPIMCLVLGSEGRDPKQMGTARSCAIPELTVWWGDRHSFSIDINKGKTITALRMTEEDNGAGEVGDLTLLEGVSDSGAEI